MRYFVLLRAKSLVFAGCWGTVQERVVDRPDHSILKENVAYGMAWDGDQEPHVVVPMHKDRAHEPDPSES